MYIMVDGCILPWNCPAVLFQKPGYIKQGIVKETFCYSFSIYKNSLYKNYKIINLFGV